MEIRQPGLEPMLISAYTCKNQFAGGTVRKQPPTVLGVVVSRGRIAWAMAGWNAVAIWEANLVGEDPPAKCRMLAAPWTEGIGGVNWMDGTRVEVKFEFGRDSHLMVGVRDRFSPQPQPLLWYEEGAGTWALGFKAVGQGVK